MRALTVPNRDQLDAILQARSGKLEETSYPILLLALATQEKSAVLELRRNQLEKKIVFDSGSPIDCRSNIATETLGRFLVSLGKISEQDCNSSLAAAATRGIPLGEVLTDRKLIAPTELYRMLQQNLGRKLLEPFSWKSGTYSISYDVPPIASSLRVKVPQLLVTGIMKVDTQESADEAASIAKGKHLAVTNDPLFGLDEIRLSKDQEKIVAAAKRGATFNEIVTTSGIELDDINRIVHALMLLGIFDVTDRAMPYMPPFALAENPFAIAEPVAPPPPPPTPATTSASSEEVMAAFLSYPRKDAFDLIGIEETEGPVAFTKGFLEMSDKYLPSKFNGDLREKAQQVFLATARAYAELADPERRDSLITRRTKSRELAAAAAQREAAALIDPEALCKNGRELVAAGKLREALSSFEMAAECDAQNGTYSAEATWCRYQLRNTPATNALKLLKNSIRIDPNCGVAYLYAGQVQAILGNKLEAQAYLSRAATLLPNDSRPAEATKTLR